jgi:hypothetical protein
LYVKSSWRQEDIGYFYPEATDNEVAGLNGLVQSNGQNFFRDTFLFIESVRNAVAFRGEEFIRSQIHNSLRGSAQNWYAMELTEVQKELLRRRSLENGWFPALMKRFKPSTTQAVRRLNTLKYGPAEVRAGRTPQMYTQEIIRACRSLNMNDRFTQLTQAWLKLDPQFKATIPTPTPADTLELWMECVADRYAVWQELSEVAQPQQNNYGNRGYYRSNNNNYQTGRQRQYQPAGRYASNNFNNTPYRPLPLRDRSRNQQAGPSQNQYGNQAPAQPYKPQQPAATPRPINISTVRGTPQMDPMRTMRRQLMVDPSTTSRQLSKTIRTKPPAVHRRLIMSISSKLEVPNRTRKTRPSLQILFRH